jgi:hypothetical protein
MADGGEVLGAPVVPGIELGRVLGRGATSEVWEGIREADGRRVAVKVTHADRESVEAAAREASLAAAAASAHVVTVEACLPLTDGRLALVMPLVRGGDLAALVSARGFLAPGEVVTVLAPVAAALGRLHAAGAVHGDVSPGNVLLDLDGRPLLGDLGLGRVVGEEPTPVWGTDGYVAPEVLLGEDPSPASDVYALGALGWLCLSGSPPGPPGLRPSLAEVSRAGEDAAALIEVVSAAVAAHARDRPTADELGWALFEAAEAVPIHLVSGDDEVSAVTYRLRAAASSGDVPRRRGRHARDRGRRRPRWPQRVPRRVPRQVRRAVGSVALVATLLGGGTAVALARPWEARPSPPLAVPATEALTPRPAPAPRRVDPRSAPVASLDDPTAVLAELAAARAAAWRRAEPARLVAAEAPGSPLHARDRVAVADLARSGLRYAGLTYGVADVRTVSAGADEVVLAARVTTGAYEVVGVGTRAWRAATPGSQVLVDLVRTRDGWRLADLRAAG